MRLTVKAGGEFPVFEAGVYPAELKSYEDAGMGQFGKERLKLVWQLLEENGEPLVDEGGNTAEIWSWVSKVISESSTLYAVICALTGQPKIAEGLEVELDDLVGQRCQLSLTVGPKKDGQGMRNNVAAYSPMRRRGAAKVAQPARQPVAAGVDSMDKVPF